VLDRVVGVLDALAPGPRSLAELAAATSLPRATAHRLAVALETHGLVARDSEGRFTLGARLVAWGSAAAKVNPLLDAAPAVLERLRDETGESAQLYVRDGDERVCVAVAEPPSGLRDTVPLGAHLALDAGSGARVLLAWAADAARFRRVAAADLAAVRRRGWAQSVGEREAGVASVSAPVRDASGQVVAAISVSGPIDRIGRQPGRRFAPAVVAAARELENDSLVNRS
jgi:DNA-binding IclR family transcriptional regulator